jgi:NADPH-dependent curcumin reductase CurA
MQLLVMRASMQGFLVFDFAERYPEGIAQLGQWLANGELRSREDVVTGGLERFPEAFLMLFRGENTGKLILQLTEAEA